MSQFQVTMPMVDGQPILPSFAKGPDGKPRFHVPLLKELINTDGGVRYLVTYESLYGGYEANSRQFFDSHLEPGDVFVDIGAHWGTFSLSAATRHPGQINVIAVEPHPLNAAQLLKAVRVNKVIDSIQVVAAAAGAEAGMAQLRHASTMGHSLDEATAGRSDVAVLHVPIVTVDSLLDARPDLADRRVFLKVDVEGYEYEVLLGARRLMESGRVAAVMWEIGDAYHAPAGREKVLRLVETLEQWGYKNYRFPSSEFAGPLVPFAPTPEIGNVFALAGDFQRLPIYKLPFEPRPPFNTLFATPADPQTRSSTTELLRAARSTDGARWANPDELFAGSQERASAAVAYITAGSHVLDIGCGRMSLQKRLPTDCRYTSADLIARSAECQVVDLNQQQFPQESCDYVALLEVLEYVHDPAWLLGRCRQSANRLIFTYHVAHNEPLLTRRERGWFNDLDEPTLAAMLQTAGWHATTRLPVNGVEGATLFVCSANGL